MKKLWLPLFVVLIALTLSACGKEIKSTQPIPTPQYSIKEELPDLSEEDTPHTAEEGIRIVVPSSDKSRDEPSPETVWREDTTVTYNAYTLPDKATLNDDGCVGILSVPVISLTINAYETDDTMEAMRHGAAHFKSTSCWDGNIGLSAHNGGVPEAVSFAHLSELKIGDMLFYTTALGDRVYKVTVIKEIADTDWSYLGRTEDNRITLITCLAGKPDQRLMVQATEN